MFYSSEAKNIYCSILHERCFFLCQISYAKAPSDFVVNLQDYIMSLSEKIYYRLTAAPLLFAGVPTQ